MTPNTSIAAFVVAVDVDGSGILPAQTIATRGQSLEDVASAISYRIAFNPTAPYSGPGVYTGVKPDHIRVTGENAGMLIRSARVGDLVGVGRLESAGRTIWKFRIEEAIATTEDCPEAGP